ncbi:MAG: endonuclease, partial [Actinomycetota bacterium]
PRPYLDALLATAETAAPAPPPLPAATVEESECVLRWLEQPGTRLVEVDGTWALPVRSAWVFLPVVEPPQDGNVPLAQGTRRQGGIR